MARQVDRDEDGSGERAAKLLGEEHKGFYTPRGCADEKNISVGHTLTAPSGFPETNPRERGGFLWRPASDARLRSRRIASGESKAFFVQLLNGSAMVLPSS